MARPRDMHSQPIGLAGAALLAVLLLVAVLIWSSWRSGLLTMRPDDLAVRLPDRAALQRAPMPDPQPAPLPRPGPGVQR